MESHSVIIAGSRNLSLDTQTIANTLRLAGYTRDKVWAEIHDKIYIESIICGEAAGVDKAGRKFAEKYNIPVESFPANWKNYGRAAGPIRNKDMATVGNSLVLFWDGKSTGSGSMKSIMLGLGKPVYEVVFKGWS